VTPEDYQNMDNFLEENMNIHDIHEADLEILIEKNVHSDIEENTEILDAKSEVEEHNVIAELRLWAIECNIQHDHLDCYLSTKKGIKGGAHGECPFSSAFFDIFF